MVLKDNQVRRGQWGRGGTLEGALLAPLALKGGLERRGTLEQQVLRVRLDHGGFRDKLAPQGRQDHRGTQGAGVSLDRGGHKA